MSTPNAVRIEANIWIPVEGVEATDVERWRKDTQRQLERWTSGLGEDVLIEVTAEPWDMEG